MAGARAVELVAEALQVSDHLRAEPSPAAALVASFDDVETAVVVTGRRPSVERVRRLARRAAVIGCAGRLAVLIGPETDVLARACRTAREHRVPNSCTSVRIAARVSRPAADAPVLDVAVRDLALGSLLARAHPSVVLSLFPDAPATIAGYQVLPCTPDLATDSLVGLGRDPVFGWPGDFLV